MMLFSRQGLLRVVFAFVFTCFTVGLSLDCIGGRAPCSGNKGKDCGVAVSAADGCVEMADDSCQGEVLTGPYTSALTAGQPANNMVHSDKFRVCVYQFDCTEGLVYGCKRGDFIGSSMVKEVVSGGDCDIPDPPEEE